MRKFAYFYFMSDDHAGIGAAAPKHAAYWRELALDEYLGGPFADRSGGLITFRCATPEDAERLVDGDPFQQHRLLERYWLREWSAA